MPCGPENMQAGPLQPKISKLSHPIKINKTNLLLWIEFNNDVLGQFVSHLSIFGLGCILHGIFEEVILSRIPVNIKPRVQARTVQNK
jgi:hypothetical protein